MIAGSVEARIRLSELIRRAMGGEEVLISNHRVPLVRLVPVVQDKPGVAKLEEVKA